MYQSLIALSGNIKFRFQERIIGFLNFFRFFQGKDAFRFQLLEIDFLWIWMLCNQIIQTWLREFWLIAFVVAVFSVTQQIDKNISVEFLTVFHRHFNRLNNRFYIVTIDMEHRTKRCFCNIGTIR